MARQALARVCRYVAYAAVALNVMSLVRPVLLPDFLVGHDAGAHQTYVFLFTRALEQGQVPVRWVEGVADGMGQPLFNHYQVGFYYMVALLHGVGLELTLALKLMVAIAWTGGATFMFLLCRPLGSLPAILAATVFVSSPYLLVDVYVRSAYPELTAIALMPGVLWAMLGVLRTGRRRYVCVLALTTALLLTSHLPATLVIAPVAAGVLVASGIVHRRPRRHVLLVGVGGLVGAGMAAFYVLPAILQLDAIHINRVTSDAFDYHRHFVRPAWWFDRSWGYAGSGQGADDQMSFQVGVVQWLVLAATVGLLATPRFRRHVSASTTAMLGWLSVVAGALFMMTAAAAPLWELVWPMTFIQFPWRLLMLPAIACGVLAAVLLSAVRDRFMQAVLVVCVVAVQWQMTAPYRAIASARERSAMDIDDPAWPTTERARDAAFREPAYDPITVGQQRAPARGRWTVDGEADVTAVSVTDAHLDLAISAPKAVRFVVHSAAYPGWQLTVDGEAVPPAIDDASGYMAIDVPAGSHRVTAAFRRDGTRTVAELISLTSFIAWLTLAIGPPGWRRPG